MSTRPLIVLAIVAVVLGAIVFIGNRPTGRVNTTNTLFAPQLAERLDDVTTVRVVGAGNTTIASLTRTADDWIVAERDGYRADTNAIRSALTLLSRATIVETMTADPNELNRLGLEALTDSEATGVGLEFLPASLGLSGIILGDSAGTSYRYARLSDGNQSWLINADPQVPTETSDWLIREILSVDGNRIERILIEHAEGETLDLFKTEVGQPNFTVADVPEDRSLQYPGVANVIGNVLRSLQLEDVAAAETGTDAEMTTTFDTFDGLVVTARGYQIDGAGWLEFVATTDTQFSNPDESIRSEAEAINRRVAGWRYRIPDYQFSQISRRMADLLSAEDSPE